MLTIEQKREICNIINGIPVYEQEKDYLLKNIPYDKWKDLICSEVGFRRLYGCTDEDGITDVTRLMFENDYADLLSDKGFIVFDEKVAIGDFLIGRVGSEVHIGKFNRDIYESETLDEKQRFKLTKVLVMANYHA